MCMLCISSWVCSTHFHVEACGWAWIWIHCSVLFCVCLEHCAYTEWNDLIITVILRHWDIFGSPFLWNNPVQAGLSQCAVQLQIQYACGWNRARDRHANKGWGLYADIELESLSISVRLKRTIPTTQETSRTQKVKFTTVCDVWFQMLYIILL